MKIAIVEIKNLYTNKGVKNCKAISYTSKDGNTLRYLCTLQGIGKLILAMVTGKNIYR